MTDTLKRIWWKVRFAHYIASHTRWANFYLGYRVAENSLPFGPLDERDPVDYANDALGEWYD